MAVQEKSEVTSMVAENVAIEICREVYAETDDAERRYDVAPELLRVKMEAVTPPALKRAVKDALMMRGLMHCFYAECKLYRDRVKGTEDGIYSAPEPKQARKLSFVRAQNDARAFLEQWEENGIALADHTGGELKALSDIEYSLGHSRIQKGEFFEWLGKQTKTDVLLKDSVDIGNAKFQAKWTKVKEGK